MEPELQPDPEVSIAPPSEDPDTGVAIGNPGTSAIPLPKAVIDQRSLKISEGVGRRIQKTTEEIRAEIANGRENVLRLEAATQIQYENQLLKQQTFINLPN